MLVIYLTQYIWNIITSKYNQYKTLVWDIFTLKKIQSVFYMYSTAHFRSATSRAQWLHEAGGYGIGQQSPLGVQSMARGPHVAQGGYEYGPTQNHKFT